MKVIPLVLAASLAANVALVVVLRRQPEAGGQGVEGVRKASVGRGEIGGAVAGSAAGSSSAEGAAKGTAAAVPENTNVAALRRLAARLKEEGFSDGIIQMAISELARRQMRDRLRELGIGGGRDPAAFWISPVTMTGSGTPEQLATQRALHKDMGALLRAVLGPSFDVSEDEHRRRAFGLPESTAQQLNKIYADYRDMEEEALLAATSPGEFRGKAELLGMEKRADIERLLTPGQLVDYELRTGGATMLQNRLLAFNATEEEFRALHAAQRALFGDSTTDIMPGQEEGERFEPEIRRILGETRYAELQAVNLRRDQPLRAAAELRPFIAGLDLPPAAATQVATLQSRFQPQLSNLAQNPSLTPEQKAARRSEIGATARAELLRVLGPEGLEAYVKSKGGWLP